MNYERNDASPSSSLWHAGEQALQLRAGSRDQLEAIGSRILRDFMPEQHREFFAELPLLFVGNLDTQNRPWASALVGRSGFISSPDPRTLRVESVPGPGDPLGVNLSVGAPVGLLGIQLETRRRNRMNGIVSEIGSSGFTVRVGQSFGNCPKYIQARLTELSADRSNSTGLRPPIREGSRLSGHAVSMIGRADTFFIASAAPDARSGRPQDGVDMSHRGGKPGFVRIQQEGEVTVLTAPDFMGNFFFNTLGNLAVNPRAGLLFVDFAAGDTLSLTGSTEIVWGGPELEAFRGAQRLLRFRVQEGVYIPDALPLRWSAPEQAPQLAMTGSWA